MPDFGRVKEIKGAGGYRTPDIAGALGLS